MQLFAYCAQKSFASKVPSVTLLGVFSEEVFFFICHLPAGRSVLGKTVPEVWSMRPRANTDRPMPANIVFFVLFCLFVFFFFCSSGLLRA